MVRNYIIIFLLIAVFVLGGICVYTYRNARELDTESRVLRNELATIGKRYTELETEYQRIAEENRRFLDGIGSDVSGLYDKASDIEQRLQDIRETGGGLADEMRAFIRTN